jgi:hypothetical protein
MNNVDFGFDSTAVMTAVHAAGKPLRILIECLARRFRFEVVRATVEHGRQRVGPIYRVAADRITQRGTVAVVMRAILARCTVASAHAASHSTSPHHQEHDEGKDNPVPILR